MYYLIDFLNYKYNLNYCGYKFFVHKTTKVFFIALCVLFFSSNALAENNNSDCILNYKNQLLKGGWDYGFYCEHGSTFVKIDTGSKKYIIYNYFYRFLAVEGGVVHGGQRVVFFDKHYNYIGQFSLNNPPLIVLSLSKGDTEKLILNDDKKSVGEILLTYPPVGILYGEKLYFFK